MRKGWCNIYVDLTAEKICPTNLNFYETKEEAESAMFIGQNICRIATIYLEEENFNQNSIQDLNKMWDAMKTNFKY